MFSKKRNMRRKDENENEWVGCGNRGVHSVCLSFRKRLHSEAMQSLSISRSRRRGGAKKSDKFHSVGSEHAFVAKMPNQRSAHVGLAASSGPPKWLKVAPLVASRNGQAQAAQLNSWLHVALCKLVAQLDLRLNGTRRKREVILYTLSKFADSNQGTQDDNSK